MFALAITWINGIGQLSVVIHSARGSRHQFGQQAVVADPNGACGRIVCKQDECAHLFWGALGIVLSATSGGEASG